MTKTKLAIAIGLGIPCLALSGLIGVSILNAAAETKMQQAQEVESNQQQIAPSLVEANIVPKAIQPCAQGLLKSNEVTEYRKFGKDIVGIITIRSTPKDSIQPVTDLPSFNAYRLVAGECIPLELGFSQWAKAVDPDTAVEMKSFFWEAIEKADPEQFKKLISVSSDVSAPFFPEDKTAIESLGHELTVRVFESDQEFLAYSLENDPFILKDHPGIEERIEGENPL